MIALDKLIPNKINFRILIVDDQANMRRTIRNMLRLLGFTSITEAGDGEDALKKLGVDAPDLILCDWNMPLKSGVEVLREVRNSERLANVPFVMITGEMDEGTVAEVIETDVDGYIVKPFVPKTLEDRITEVLNRRMNPSELDTRLEAAAGLIRAGSYDEAQKQLDKAAEISGDTPKLFFLRGLAFEGDKDAASAEYSYAKAAQIGPKFLRAREKLAEIYEKQGKTDSLAKVLAEAAKISPKNANRQDRLGKALLAEGRLTDAKNAFVKALQIEPENTARKAAIAEAYLANGFALQAEQLFKSALRATPDDLHLYNRLGIAFRRQKKFKEAIENYRLALSIAPNEENLLYNLGRAYLEAGDLDNARNYLKRAVAIKPDFAEAIDLLQKLSRQTTA